MREWIVQGLTPILCGLALLLGVIGAGRATRASLHDRAAYRLASSRPSKPARAATRRSVPSATIGNCRDDAQVAAAKTAAFLQPHLAQLNLEGGQIKTVEGEIIFIKPGVRIIWGHAPGQEKEGEAPAQVKLRRLLDYQEEHDGLGNLEHDVRLLAYQGHFPLPPDEPRNTVSLYEQASNSSRSWRSCFNDAKPLTVNASSR